MSGKFQTMCRRDLHSVVQRFNLNLEAANRLAEFEVPEGSVGCEILVENWRNQHLCGQLSGDQLVELRDLPRDLSPTTFTRELDQLATAFQALSVRAPVGFHGSMLAYNPVADKAYALGDPEMFLTLKRGLPGVTPEDIMRVLQSAFSSVPEGMRLTNGRLLQPGAKLREGIVETDNHRARSRNILRVGFEGDPLAPNAVRDKLTKMLLAIYNEANKGGKQHQRLPWTTIQTLDSPVIFTNMPPFIPYGQPLKTMSSGCTVLGVVLSDHWRHQEAESDNACASPLPFSFSTEMLFGEPHPSDPLARDAKARPFLFFHEATRAKLTELPSDLLPLEREEEEKATVLWDNPIDVDISAPIEEKAPSEMEIEPVIEEIEPAIEKAVPAMEEAVPVPAIEEAVPVPAIEEAVPVPAIEEAIPVPAIEEAIPAEIPAPQVMKLLEVADLPRKTVARALTSVRPASMGEEEEAADKALILPPIAASDKDRDIGPLALIEAQQPPIPFVPTPTPGGPYSRNYPFGNGWVGTPIPFDVLTKMQHIAVAPLIGPPQYRTRASEQLLVSNPALAMCQPRDFITNGIIANLVGHGKVARDVWVYTIPPYIWKANVHDTQNYQKILPPRLIVESYDIIALPYNYGGNHWNLIWIERRVGKGFLFEPIKSTHLDAEQKRTVKVLVQEVWKTCLGQPSNLPVMAIYGNQKDVINCGIYCCMMADAIICRGCPLNEYDTYSTLDAMWGMIVIAASLMTGRILNDHDTAPYVGPVQYNVREKTKNGSSSRNGNVTASQIFELDDD
ncbi:hypothetical protein DFJ77DRAFT_443249 [Powellomyces hirtus]|nr:hypothetical protein DFJ77DRAFT_443249 [Powellomyces hirtus]